MEHNTNNNTIAAPARAAIDDNIIIAAIAGAVVKNVAAGNYTTKKEIKQVLQVLQAAGARTLNVTRKNKKLVPNKNTAFIIWNLPAVITCPGATASCKKYCYARTAEKMYKQVYPYRVNNFNESRDPGFILNMFYTILSIYAGTRKKNVVVRIHESGDFYNQNYVDCWLVIMKMLERLPGLHFIAYTKSFRYFDGRPLPDNFSLRASIWNDTPAADLDIIRRNDWNIYTAVPEFTPADSFTRCRCNDCASCGLCWNNAVKDIRCKIH